MIISVWFTKMKFSLKNAKINVLWPPYEVFTKRKNTYSFKWCSSKVTPANLRKKQHKTQILVKKNPKYAEQNEKHDNTQRNTRESYTR